MEHVTDNNLDIDALCMYAPTTTAEARAVGKEADRVYRKSKICQDPIKARLMQQAAEAMWSQSLGYFIRLHRERGQR